MSFWAWLGLSILFGVAKHFLTQKQKTTNEPGKIEPPEIEPGAPIPVLWGTLPITGHVVWFGGYEAVKVTKKVNGDPLGITRQTVDLGFRYKVDMAIVLTHGDGHMIALQNIRFDKRKWLTSQTDTREIVGVPNPFEYTYTTTDPWRYRSGEPSYNNEGLADADHAGADGMSQFTLYMPNLYGGREKEGGVEGDFDFYVGNHRQTYNTYIADHAIPQVFTTLGGSTPITPAIVPDWFDLCYVVLRGVDMGMSPSLKMWEFEVTRRVGEPNVGTDQGSWMSGDLDANPVHIIWDCLVNRRYGLGIPESMLDVEWFRYEAQEMGIWVGDGARLSLYMNERQTAQDVIDEVLRTCDGVLDRDPYTNLLRVKFLREGDDPFTTPLTLQPDDYAVTDGVPFSLLSVEGTRREWHDTINDVTVTFTNRTIGYAKVSVSVRNDANVHMTGSVRSQVVDFPAITDETYARKRAERILAAGSRPLWKGTLRATRAAYGLRRGDRVRVRWPDLFGNTVMTMRCLAIDLGSLEEGVIVIEAIEDAFTGISDVSDPAVSEPVSTTPPDVNAYDVPVVEPIASLTSQEGTVGLNILDIGNHVTKVEFATQVGGGAPSAFVTDASSPYTKTVALSSLGTSRIFWRVTYTDATGAAATIENYYDFAAKGGLPAPTLWAEPGAVVAGSQTTSVYASAVIEAEEIVYFVDDQSISDTQVRTGIGMPQSASPPPAGSPTWTVFINDYTIATTGVAYHLGAVAVRYDPAHPGDRDYATISPVARLRIDPPAASGGASSQLVNAGFPTPANGHYIDFAVPADMTVAAWEVMVQPTSGNTTGTITFDVLQATDAAWPTLTSLVGAGQAPKATAQARNAATPTGWTTTAIAAGNTVRVKVNGTPTNVDSATLVLSLSKV